MQNGDRVGIVCCSNGQKPTWKGKLELLNAAMKRVGLTPVFSDYIFEKQDVSSGTPTERAKALMDFYRDSSIKAVFDISGGDIANEVLPYIDFGAIASTPKLFWGYSDLTVIINAIYARTGKESVLYQVRNLIGKSGEIQREEFENTVLGGKSDLFRFQYRFIQGTKLSGIVVGGNIRCFLKLAGTSYFPDTDGKILLLEGFHGEPAQMRTYLSQLSQMGVWERVSGILLGTFTQMQEENCKPDIVSLVLEYAGDRLPVAKTEEIGHGADSKGIVIGRNMELTETAVCL